jgi:hypothetical protein
MIDDRQHALRSQHIEHPHSRPRYLASRRYRSGGCTRRIRRISRASFFSFLVLMFIWFAPFRSPQNCAVRSLLRALLIKPLLPFTAAQPGHYLVSLKVLHELRPGERRSRRGGRGSRGSVTQRLDLGDARGRWGWRMCQDRGLLPVHDWKWGGF